MVGKPHSIGAVQLLQHYPIAPRVINVDRNPSYPKAIKKLQNQCTLPKECELRPIKYLNNLIEQDHRLETVGLH